MKDSAVDDAVMLVFNMGAGWDYSFNEKLEVTQENPPDGALRVREGELNVWLSAARRTYYVSIGSGDGKNQREVGKISKMLPEHEQLEYIRSYLLAYLLGGGS